MNEVVWKDEYNIGVDLIDREHRRLFKIINKVYAFVDNEKKSQWACQEGIKFFRDHASRHFADEEAYMADMGYPDLKVHKRAHSRFRDSMLPVLEQELEKTGYSRESVEHFLGVCVGWLIGHTLTEDRAMAQGAASQWNSLLSDQDLDALSKALVQLIYDMFQLESTVVSDVYGGEKFGKGVYYRLVYGPGPENPWELVFVFEERFLVQTVGKILGLETNKLDSMLVNAARHMTQQLVLRIRDYLPDVDLQTLQEENLLTYEQFQGIFQANKPQASLLFDTGAGYFAFCVIAPAWLQQGIGHRIDPDSASSQVEAYLTDRATAKENRKTVLVVDDSLVVRENIGSLLSPDYETVLVSSGMAAIRSMIINRPDLVLLDYEMPVCDGRQVLEMIRSDDGLKGLPVFFLTGRVDPESVRRVIPLKPEGYLSKSLKPEEIKRNIDQFFLRIKA